MKSADETMLWALMAAGMVFACTGLYLLLRPPKVDGETRIEAFGIKFNASSGGIVVFVVGAAFLAAPILVPKTPDAKNSSAPNQPGTTTVIQDPTPSLIPPRPIANGKEIEPNDNYDQATQIAAGESITGFFNEASPDWVAISVDPTNPFLYIKVRNTGERWTSCGIEFRSADEKDIFPHASFNYPDVNTAKVWKAPINGTRAVFVWLSSRSSSGCGYEIFTSYSRF